MVVRLDRVFMIVPFYGVHLWSLVIAWSYGVMCVRPLCTINIKIDVVRIVVRMPSTLFKYQVQFLIRLVI